MLDVLGRAGNPDFGGWVGVIFFKFYLNFCNNFFRIFLYFMFPNPDDFPAEPTELCARLFISVNVIFYFCQPIFFRETAFSFLNLYPCQKSPSMKIAIFCFTNATSGLPSNLP